MNVVGGQGVIESDPYTSAVKGIEVGERASYPECYPLPPKCRGPILSHPGNNTHHVHNNLPIRYTICKPYIFTCLTS